MHLASARSDLELGVCTLMFVVLAKLVVMRY